MEASGLFVSLFQIWKKNVFLTAGMVVTTFGYHVV